MCCILIKISITVVIQIQADFVISDTNGFINFWLQFLPTQFLKAYANHTMLTPPPTCCTSCGVRSQFISASWNLKIWSNLIRSKKTQLLPSTVFSKSSFSGPSLLGMTSSTLQPHFFLGVYYDKWWLLYLFCTGIRLHHLTMHVD